MKNWITNTSAFILTSFYIDVAFDFIEFIINND